MWASSTLERDQKSFTSSTSSMLMCQEIEWTSVNFIDTFLLLSQIQRRNSKTIWLNSLTTTSRITNWIDKILTWSIKCHKICFTHNYLESLNSLLEIAIAFHYRKLKCKSTFSNYTHVNDLSNSLLNYSNSLTILHFNRLKHRSLTRDERLN